ncbi:dephospho-CoA kinase [Candidatus Actinomarina sp.]|nr:dephospho-CoA kinase [Candidatus Actinomarina sp.]MDC3404349.1 dephospho-CoA kinase [Acidimicrobiia bacterium]
MDSRVTIITGPIGSGKSTACEYLATKNFKTIDLDQISNEILQSHNSLPFLKEEFSNCLKGNVIDRQLLADNVFTNSEKLRLLENYLHPLVTERVLEVIQDTTEHLFIEASAPKNISKLYPTVVIFADEQTRRTRLKKRGMSLTDIDNRIKTQQEESWWKSLGLVVENISFKELQEQLDNFLDLKNE